jgi:anti-anti-sigma factor
MDLKQEIVGEVTVVEVKGRVDSSTAPVLGERLTTLLAAPSQRLVLDMRDLEYISSAGFRVLLLAARRADEAAARLVLCGLSSKVRQLFDLGGFLDLFAISASRDEALTAAR